MSDDLGALERAVNVDVDVEIREARLVDLEVDGPPRAACHEHRAPVPALESSGQRSEQP